MAHTLHPGQLTAVELTALTAALATRPEPNALCTAARLTQHLRDERLGALLLQACLGVDLGTLLTPATPNSDTSIEDVLLNAIVETAPLHTLEIRARLLERLRGAGHSQLEIDILSNHGTASEIADALPGIFAEGQALSLEHRERLLERSRDNEDHGSVVRALLASDA